MFYYVIIITHVLCTLPVAVGWLHHHSYTDSPTDHVELASVCDLSTTTEAFRFLILGSGSWSGTDSRIHTVMRIVTTNVTSWSLGHTQALHQIHQNPSIFFCDYPVNTDFGLRNPRSGSSPKLNSLVPGPYPTPLRNFVKIRSQNFQLSDVQTHEQTDKHTQVGLKHSLLRWRSSQVK